MNTRAELLAAIKRLQAYEIECNTYLWAHAAGEPLDLDKLRLVDQQIADEKKEIVRLGQLWDAECSVSSAALVADMKAWLATKEVAVQGLRDRREAIACEIDATLARLASLAADLKALGVDMACTARIPFDPAAHPFAMDAVENAMRLRAAAYGLKWAGGDRPAQIPPSMGAAIYALDSEFMARQTVGK